MKLGIMQPYCFPYIGYFQLIHSVEKFIFYDDVNFIKQSWINRNRILLNKDIYTFSIPVQDISSFRPINETKISNKKEWRNKLLKTFEQAYKKAPYFSTIFRVLEDIISRQNFLFISELARESVFWVKEYLDISTKIVYSSAIYANTHIKGQQRIIDICKKEKSETYINAPGGVDLYDHDVFKKENIELKFINPGQTVYKQFDTNIFIPNLSIIDLLMFNSKSTLKLMLNNYELC